MSMKKIKPIAVTGLIALGAVLAMNTLAKRSQVVAQVKNTVDNGL